MIKTLNDKFGGFFRMSDAVSWKEESAGKPTPYYSIILNFSGTLTIQKDFNSYDLTCGQACFITPGSYITDIISTEQADNWILDFDQTFYCLEQHDKDLSCNGLLFGAINDIALLSFDDSDKTNNQHLMQIMSEELEKTDQNTADMIRLLLKRLIIKAVRIGRAQLFKTDTPDIQDTDVVRQFQALVEKNFKEKHKVGDYAELMFKSSKTLSNSFKLLKAKSPLQIIHDRIILEAKRQLVHTDRSIKEIGYYLGFEEAAQFSRLFKKITDHSPSDFQKRYA